MTTDLRSAIDQARRVPIEAFVKLESLDKAGAKEWKGPCPFCGGTNRFSIQPSRNRWLCRGCAGGRWRDVIDFVRWRDKSTFAEAVQTLTQNPLQAVSTAVVEHTRTKTLKQTKRLSTALLGPLEAHPERYARWRQYKPLSDEAIFRFRLGVGRLPLSRCKHERLIVPVFSGGELIGMRGRALGCDCPKWLTSAGSQAALFGLDEVRPGSVVWVCGNNVDAIMVMDRYPDYCAVSSTVGEATWRGEWTEALAALSPEMVVIALDNDLVGCPNPETYRAELARWREKNPEATWEPKPAGPRIANELLAAGVRASLWEWPAGTPAKADIGEFLSKLA